LFRRPNESLARFCPPGGGFCLLCRMGGSFAFSSFAFSSAHGQGAIIAEDCVVEKHVPRQVVDVVAFPDAPRIMFQPDEADGDGA